MIPHWDSGFWIKVVFEEFVYDFDGARPTCRTLKKAQTFGDADGGKAVERGLKGVVAYILREPVQRKEQVIKNTAWEWNDQKKGEKPKVLWGRRGLRFASRSAASSNNTPVGYRELVICLSSPAAFRIWLCRAYDMNLVGQRIQLWSSVSRPSVRRVERDSRNNSLRISLLLAALLHWAAWPKQTPSSVQTIWTFKFFCKEPNSQSSQQILDLPVYNYFCA